MQVSPEVLLRYAASTDARLLPAGLTITSKIGTTTPMGRRRRKSQRRRVRRDELMTWKRNQLQPLLAKVWKIATLACLSTSVPYIKIIAYIAMSWKSLSSCLEGRRASPLSLTAAN